MEPDNLKLSLPLDEVIKMKEKGKTKSEVQTEKFKKVFVGNLNFSTNWQKLKDYMKKAGNVLYADVFLDHKGRSKGCGLVEFSEHDEALKAIKVLNDTKLDGRYIYIREDNLSFVKTSKDYEGSERKRSREKSKSRSRSRSNSRKKHKNHKEKEKKKEHKKTAKSSKKIHKNKSKSKSKSIKSKSKSRSKSKSLSRQRSKSPLLEKHDSINNNNNVNNNVNNNGSEMKIEEPLPSNEDKNSTKRKTSLSLEEKDKGYHLEIKNLPYNVTWQNVKDAFANFGHIVTADVENDNTEKTNAVGFVVFERKRDALKAIDGMHRAFFNGNQITVKMIKR